ncbi:MAG: 6-bladed beta-propeller [Bacteroidales bacterium]|jgi:hypothetical protein
MIFSCAKTDNNSINLDQMDKVSVRDLVDSISVVQLETKEESLIGGIQRIISHKNRFYIVDYTQQAVLCFNANGEYLFKINKRGRGPEEYNYLGEFNIDPYNDQLMILVPWGNILYYDLDGNFISKVKLPSEVQAYNEVYALNRDKLLFISWNEYQASYYSKVSGKILKRFLHVTNDKQYIFNPLHKTYYYSDSLFFNNVGINNDVLNLTDEIQSIAYSWNFGKNNNTTEQINEAQQYEQRMSNERNPNSSPINNLGNKDFPNYYTFTSFETKKYRITSLLYKDPGTFLMIFNDKNDGKNYVFRETTEGIGFYFLSVYESSLITYKTKFVENYFSKNVLTPDQFKIVENHNPNNDNPFLVIYHFK